MALSYSIVAHHTTILAEYSAFAGNTTAIARSVLEKLPLSPYASTRNCFSVDPYNIHLLRSDDHLVFLCVSNNTLPRTIAFQYLEDIRGRFINDYKLDEISVDVSTIGEFSSVLRQQMELINQDTDAFDSTAKDCEKYTVAEESIEQLLDKLEQIKLIDDKTTTIDFECLDINMKNKCSLHAEDMHVKEFPGTSTKTANKVPAESLSDDDWEAIADLPPEKLLAPDAPPKVTNRTPDNHESTAPKRRGRGTFSYKKEELYSDRVSGKSCPSEQPDLNGVESDGLNRSSELHSSRCSTGHVLVLSGFSPTTKTIDIEKLFDDFRDHEFVIQWVDNTTALVVFKTAATALEALKSKKFPFSVRILEEDDSLVASLPSRNLEPPRPRPKTSAVTARRLIAHGMGIKLPSNSDSSEFRKQEEARKKRILARQSLKEDAWGNDD